ncbi:molybdenum cofactor guanylyltransferase MobA [Aquamicrobium zhengzhouense]|nr:molybdenum cofactor guanylyltransferase MobA [Aquamicrobium zhengzhouense]
MATDDKAMPQRKDIPVLILAGGQATRMGGGDKALLKLGKETLLDHILTRLRPQTSVILLNANGDAQRFKEYGLDVIPDTVEDWPGPLAGVLAGLEWAFAHGHEKLISVAADTPFVPDDLVESLEQAAQSQMVPVALAASRDENGSLRRHPTFGLWPVSIRADLRAQLEAGQRRVGAFADRHGAACALFEGDEGDPFFNVNTPDDLEIATQRLERVPS